MWLVNENKLALFISNKLNRYKCHFYYLIRWNVVFSKFKKLISFFIISYFFLQFRIEKRPFLLDNMSIIQFFVCKNTCLFGSCVKNSFFLFNSCYFFKQFTWFLLNRFEISVPECIFVNRILPWLSYFVTTSAHSVEYAEVKEIDSLNK